MRDKYPSALHEKEIISAMHEKEILCHCFKVRYFSLISEPYVTEEELKLMLRGAELSGAIEEEEQVISYILKVFC